MTVLAMSHGELSQFDTLMRVDRGDLRVEGAAALLGLKRRQIFRLLERLRLQGITILHPLFVIVRLCPSTYVGLNVGLRTGQLSFGVLSDIY